MKKIALIKDRSGFYKVYKGLFEEYGHNVIPLDVWNEADHERLIMEDWDAFFWRAKHNPKIRDLAKRLSYYFDKVQNIKCFPAYRDYWHYDSKINQFYIFTEKGIPIAKTKIFYNKDDALNYADRIELPVIVKCSSGAGSSNVKLMKNRFLLKHYIKKVFKTGVKTYFKSEIQRDYVYIQEFISGCQGDYRIVCLGNEEGGHKLPPLLTGFFRYNEQATYFASGSGKYEMNYIDEKIIDFVSKVHSKLSNNLMSYDILKKDKKFLITEMSVIYGDLKSPIYYNSEIFVKKSDTWQKLDQGLDNLARHKLLFIEKILDLWGWL